MEAPNKLYLHPTAKGEVGKNWLIFPLTNEDAEYTRTDVIVERAVQFIKERLNFADNAWYIEGEVTIKDKVIEDFKNYMKGE